jgi:hypothetical protein
MQDLIVSVSKTGLVLIDSSINFEAEVLMR